MITLDELYALYKKSSAVTIDSRKIQGGELFFAFSGENFNAATLALQAVQNGALAVIVEDENFADVQQNIYYVSSTLQTLQNLAKYHRQQLSIPIIALTGSNGKTTTKELIHAVLSQKFNVQYTLGNLNNHIGVPLTLLSINEKHEMAIVEMGANHQQEIALLCEIAQPDYGYITNFGKAHLEGFGGFEGVIKGKSEMYSYLMTHQKTILVNAEDEIQVEKTKGYSPKISFGNEWLHTVNYGFEEIVQAHRVGVRYKNRDIWSQLTGVYNYTNLCAAVALGLHFEVELEKTQQGITDYFPSNMRSQIEKRGVYNIIVDTYNANPSSMELSLKNFKDFEGYKIAILGDMLELGEVSHEEHKKIYQFAKGLGIDEIYTVGKFFMEINHEKSFEKTQELAQYLATNPLLQGHVLLKGSRGMKLEQLLDEVRKV